MVFVSLSLWTPTHIYIGFVSLGLLDQTDSHHSALWTQTNFDMGTLSLSLIPQILLAFDSLSLWTPTYINDSFPSVCSTKLTLITQPCGRKHIFTWVHFPSAWFLKFDWRSIRSAYGHQHTHRICCPRPSRPNCLKSLSLVDPNKF